MNTGGVLVVTSACPSRGSGHLRRSARLVLDLREAGQAACLFIADRDIAVELEALSLLSGLSKDCLASICLTAESVQTEYRLVIVDAFKTSRTLFKRLSALGPLLGIDEGGPSRASFDWLIDILPNPLASCPPNAWIPRLCLEGLSPRSFPQAAQTPPKRILVSFGGEDASGTTARVLEQLASSKGLAMSSVEVLLPPAMDAALRSALEERARGLGATVRPPAPMLARELPLYELVITQFGRTAFEALLLGIPVWTRAPSPLHNKLSQALDLPSHEGGYRLDSPMDIRRIFERSKALATSLLAKDGGSVKKGSLFEHISSFTVPAPAFCPVCRLRSSKKTLARFPDRTYRRCPRCKTVHMIRMKEGGLSYDASYFFEEYQSQYGKTYLEDFQNLRAHAAARLELIEPLIKSGQRVLLDIGCAYGPFLAEAAARDWKAMGIDASIEAVKYINEELAIAAVQGLFPHVSLKESFERERFPLVSLWYVIEHSPDLGSLLQSLARVVEEGGILACSTPSGAGISSRKNLRDFLEKSPSDHWTILDPRYIGALLKPFGFTLEKIRITGHHPQRFPLMRELRPNSILWRIVLWVSRHVGLGDTFEFYARRGPGL